MDRSEQKPPPKKKEKRRYTESRQFRRITRSYLYVWLFKMMRKHGIHSAIFDSKMLKFRQQLPMVRNLTWPLAIANRQTDQAANRAVFFGFSWIWWLWSSLWTVFSLFLITIILNNITIIFISWSLSKLIWRFPKIGVPPPIIHFNVIFREINHLFWGIPIYGKLHIWIIILHNQF